MSGVFWGEGFNYDFNALTVKYQHTVGPTLESNILSKSFYMGSCCKMFNTVITL